MLLRTAIGWHFLYEGVSKISTTPAQRDTWAGFVLTKILPAPYDKDKEKDPPFSAEGYLRNATGPLAPKFRALVPDVNSMAKLERDAGGHPTRLMNAWKAQMGRIEAHYGFDQGQKDKAEEIYKREAAKLDDWFLDPENARKVRKYYRDLRHVLDVEQSPESLPYQKTQAYKDRKDVEKARRELVADVDLYTGTFTDAVTELATADQKKARGPLSAPWTTLDLVNLTTMWGLVLVGLGLMLGLLTPLAALGGAGYLLMFYLSMPPWPGLPTAPAAEGHYLYINKNMVELIACLVLASTPNGLWLGLDALLFGRFGRKRAEPAAPNPANGPVVAIPTAAGSGVSGHVPQRRSKR